MPSFIDPNLPPELERQIFEIAALLYPEYIPALILVAQRVKTWIEPMLYGVLYLCRTPDPEKPIRQLPLATVRSLIESRPASFFHTHVRHIRLFEFYDDVLDDIMKILAVCDATVNLQLLLASADSLLPCLGALPLQRLAVNLRTLFPSTIDFLHPVFAQITHLDLFDFEMNDVEWGSWSALAKMPQLTHLSFLNNLVPNTLWKAALTHCKSLQVLAIMCSKKKDLDSYAPDGAELGSDPRFVMLVVADILVDWESGARGGQDHWVIADEFVCKRRAGEIEGYCIM
ncbi:hypothetical protein B0H19DRAFT_1167567 [Mycena capillaripes]|nr:hypothetical protein B0H19DRAFT_1167567 [Mycena capillaripes]